jgi:hypothetical protein
MSEQPPPPPQESAWGQPSPSQGSPSGRAAPTQPPPSAPSPPRRRRTGTITIVAAVVSGLLLLVVLVTAVANTNPSAPQVTATTVPAVSEPTPAAEAPTTTAAEPAQAQGFGHGQDTAGNEAVDLAPDVKLQYGTDGQVAESVFDEGIDALQNAPQVLRAKRSVTGVFGFAVPRGKVDKLVVTATPSYEHQETTFEGKA